MKFLVLKASYVTLKRNKLTTEEKKLNFAVDDRHGNRYYVSELGYALFSRDGCESEDGKFTQKRSYSKLFNTEITLDNLEWTRSQLTWQAAIARYGFGVSLGSKRDTTQDAVVETLANDIESEKVDVVLYKGGFCEQTLADAAILQNQLVLGGVRVYNLEEYNFVEKAFRNEDYNEYMENMWVTSDGEGQSNIVFNFRYGMCSTHHAMIKTDGPAVISKSLRKLKNAGIFCAQRTALHFARKLERRSDIFLNFEDGQFDESELNANANNWSDSFAMDDW